MDPLDDSILCCMLLLRGALCAIRGDKVDPESRSQMSLRSAREKSIGRSKVPGPEECDVPLPLPLMSAEASGVLVLEPWVRG